MADLVVLATHAIQYQAPLFRELTQNQQLDLLVCFMREPAVEKPYWDVEFGREVKWDIPLLDGYRSCVLSGSGSVSRLASFVRVHRREGKPPVMLTGWSTPLHWAIWVRCVIGHVHVLLGAETNSGSYGQRSRPRIQHALLKQLIRRTHALLCIGKRNEEFYRWMKARPAQLIHYPYSVDNERFRAACEKQSATRVETMRRFGLNPQLPTLVSVGKLIRKKRPDLLLEGVRKSGLAGRVNVAFVGEGALRGELEQLARRLEVPNVAFVGFLNQTEMPLSYVIGDVLCLLSDVPSETWGLVVNEAMACSRPVVVSDACGCVPDLVEGKGTGWVVKAGDPDDLAATLKDVLHRQSEWPALGEAGRQVVAGHTFTRMAEAVSGAVRGIEKTGARGGAAR